MNSSGLAVAAFLAAFYLSLVGSKVMIVIMAGRSRQFLDSRAYRVVMRLPGIMLAVFAVLLFRQGLQYWRCS